MALTLSNPKLINPNPSPNPENPSQARLLLVLVLRRFELVLPRGARGVEFTRRHPGH